MPETTAPAAGPGSLLVDGAFRASESGRTLPVLDHRQQLLGQVDLASRRDVRDAVAAAPRGARAWADVPADRRLAQLLAVASSLTADAGPLAEAVAAAEDVAPKRAAELVDAAVERWVHLAGWTDKTEHLGWAGSTVAGSRLTATVVRPVGVVAVLAPRASSLLGLVTTLAPVLVTGSAAVVVASQDRPLPALALARAVVRAGLPPGALGLLTGRTAELAPWLAGHRDVDAVDLAGAPAAQRTDLEQLAAGAGNRVVPAPGGEPDWTRPPDLARLRVLLARTTITS